MSKLIYPQKNMHFQSKTLAIVALIIGIFGLFQQAHPEAEIMFLISILFGSYQHAVELNPDENSIRSSRRIFFSILVNGTTLICIQTPSFYEKPLEREPVII